MNNLEKYISEVDSIKADSDLKESILELNNIKKRKLTPAKIIPFAAAVMIILIAPFLAKGIFSASKMNAGQVYEAAADFDSFESNAKGDFASEKTYWYSSDTIEENEEMSVFERETSVVVSSPDSKSKFVLNEQDGEKLLSIINSIAFSPINENVVDDNCIVIHISSELYYFSYDYAVLLHNNESANLTEEENEIINSVINSYSD